MQVYLFPMLVIQLEPKIPWALRNAAMLVLAQPIFTLAVALELAALVVACTIFVLPILSIGVSAMALLSCVALNDRLTALRIRKRQKAEQAGAESPEPQD